MTTPLKERAEAFYRQLQADICAALEQLDGEARFGHDAWERPEGGGGSTRVIADGALFEKGAVNVSAVWGPAPPQLVEHLQLEAESFFATGISMIFHPRNPHCPTFHANVRYFEAGEAAWFGGGCDLTPYYLYPEDARHFHTVVRDACDHPAADYPAWKAWCDRYFHNAHRGEARGVGGVFFDHVAGDLEQTFAAQQAVGRCFVPAYAPVLERRRALPVTPEQVRWHLQRRGRYVEFNLIHDRGTRFGLQTGGRIESILVSMPPRVRWDYDARPDPGTPEQDLLDVLEGAPRDWLADA